jgi:hypothetical protein
MEGGGSLFTRPSVDIATIIGVEVERDERLSVVRRLFREELVEEALPCRSMHAGGARENAVEIEQQGLVITR